MSLSLFLNDDLLDSKSPSSSSKVAKSSEGRVQVIISGTKSTPQSTPQSTIGQGAERPILSSQEDLTQESASQASLTQSEDQLLRSACILMHE